MDFLKNQFGRLQQQFNQLNASQKMLSMALVAIMAMTLVWWGHYAGQAEMEPLLDQDFSAEDLSRVVADLRGRGIPFTPVGSRILVPADRKFEVLGDLIFQQIIPRDMSSSVADSAVKGGSPFDSSEQQREQRNDIKQATLAAIIRNFPNVQNARVLIDATQKRTFDNPITAKATVSLKMKAGTKADNRLVNAAADVVSGAVAGLKRSAVKVIVDGVSRLSAADDGSDGAFGAGQWMDTVRDAESYYATKVYEQLAFCDGVMVHVNVLPKDESSETHTKTFDPKGVLLKEIENETETHTSNPAANRPSGDTGVVPNTGSNQGMTIGAGADGPSSNMEKQRTKNQVLAPETTRITRSPAGSVTVTSVSVGLPKSYFVKACKAEKHMDKDPSDVVLTDYVKNELDKCRSSVKACLSLQADAAVFVDTYADLLPNTPESPTPTASGVSLLVGNHGKEIALGALALVSLFMVSTMVRKGGPALASPVGAIAHAPGSTVDALLAKAAGVKASAKITAEDAAEVGESGQTLDGVELDDETVRAQQVVEQVSTLVKENPDVAASLVKRWLSRA